MAFIMNDIFNQVVQSQGSLIMPKKFTGENSKVAEARSRKEAAKSAEQKKKQAAAEDEYWKDDDKGVMKKLQRKDDKEKKRLELLARKAELKTLADEETKSIKVEPKQAAHKITRLQIQVLDTDY